MRKRSVAEHILASRRVADLEPASRVVFIQFGLQYTDHDALWELEHINWILEKSLYQCAK